MGWVGSSVAISILHRGLCKHLLINDARPGIADGEAMDLRHGSGFLPSTEVRSSSIEEMLDCEIIVITAGRGGKPGETRLDLLTENIQIAKQISERLMGFNGILLIVSNPVDVLTYYYQVFTGLPKNRVLGTGTMLDTARLREAISDYVSIEPKNIHAYVVGEHGDSEVVLWSKAMVGTAPLRDWPGWTPQAEKLITEQVRTAAQEIIKRKGATNHAIGLVTAELIKTILHQERSILSVSTVVNHPTLGEVAYSLPCVVSQHGAEEILPVYADEQEKAKIEASVGVLRTAIDSVRKI